MELQDQVSSEAHPASNSGSDVFSYPRRWLHVVEWLLIALLAVQFGARTLPEAWKTLNTDFPNYYLTASLVHEHYDTSRIYEWVWIERQKDHRDIDQRIVGMVPITGFSTLVVYPLTGLSALAAKHWWTVFNLGLLLATLFLLRALTQLSWRRIALVAALSFPLRVNFLYGQYYVLLLFLLTLACYLYLRQRRFLAGVMVGIAAGLKVFPVVYFLYFLRKRDWKALAGAVVSGVGAAVVSLLVFGWKLNQLYLSQVLPATLRGEGLDPYNLRAESLSTLLHKLFIYEPLLNLHPAINAAWLFAVLHPLLQMAIVAPALLLAAPRENDGRRVRLEWAAILMASLATSTSASPYLFTLLILPACVALEVLRGRYPYLSVAVLLPVYVAAGTLGGTDQVGDGWGALVGPPRLYAVLLFCGLVYVLLNRQWRRDGAERERFKWDRAVWAAALLVIMSFSIWTNLRHQRGLFDDYRWRMPAQKDVYLATDPAPQGDAVLFVAMMGDGYHAAVEEGGVARFSGSSQDDMLAVSAAGGQRWVEQVGHASAVVSNTASFAADGVVIPQAESPVASFDGRWLAFLREDHGRARIWVRALGQQVHTESADRPVTPRELNVLEMSFLPTGELIFAADSGGQMGLFVTEQAGNQTGTIRSLRVERARYPAVSPDGRWLAYDQLEGGNWNLWLRDLRNGQTQRLTHAECNSMKPAWAADSQTLVYASDCGRGLWFTALYRRRVVP
jgi:hypothetical protein